MKSTHWKSWFAWHPVFVQNGYLFDSIVWLRTVKRRWIPPWESFDGTVAGHYQYIK